MEMLLRALHRKQADLRKHLHRRMANRLLSMGDELYVEDMRWKALAKRAKETKRSKKGKILSKNLTTSGRLSPLQVVSKAGTRPSAFGLIEMEPLGSIGEIRFRKSLPHDLPLEDVPLLGCRKATLRLEDGAGWKQSVWINTLLEPTP